MAFGGFEQGASQPMSEINMTPLVDVMLVLLIIFMVCAPLMTQSITVNLPKAAGTTTQDKPKAIKLSIDPVGKITWNGESVADENLVVRLTEAATQQPQPELHLMADKEVRYERVAQVMAQVKEAGITKLGFVMLPGGGVQPVGAVPNQ
ncbi:MAG: biopolymer transporter ExbD [Pseudomonadales bacterium]